MVARTRLNVTSYVYCLPRLSSNPDSSLFVQPHKTSQSYSYRYVLQMSVVSKLLGTMAKSRHKMSAGHIVKIAYIFTCLSLMIIHCRECQYSGSKTYLKLISNSRHILCCQVLTISHCFTSGSKTWAKYRNGYFYVRCNFCLYFSVKIVLHCR
jgi:hypothetical protein